MNGLGIALKGGACYYEQIYEAIRKDILTGKLRAGERLPSTRFLADFLSVSRTTTSAAYDQLLSEGYLDARPRKGYFVSDISLLYKTVEKVQEKEKQDPSPLSCAKKEKRIDFSPRAIDMSAFPFPTWKKLIKEAFLEGGEGLLSLGEQQGDLPLREAISHYLSLSRGVSCNPSRIVIGAGEDYLLMLLRQILGRRQTAMEEVSYVRGREIFKRLGNSVLPIPMDENGMVPEHLRKSKASLVFLMPGRQYPCGLTMPAGRRGELLAWAEEEDDRFLIEDDYDSEFRYRGRPVPSLQGMDKRGRVIYMGTFSKAIAPAIRISYMVLPETLLGRFVQNCSCYSCTVSRLDQAVLGKFLREGFFERYLNKMRRRYKQKQELVMAQTEALKENYELKGTGAGLHVLLSEKKTISSSAALMKREKKIAQKLQKAGALVYPLHEFDLTGERTYLQSPSLVLGYAGLTENEIKKGCTILQEVLADL